MPSILCSGAGRGPKEPDSSDSRLAEHIPELQDRRWPAVDLADDRACHDAAEHRAVVHLESGLALSNSRPSLKRTVRSQRDASIAYGLPST